MSFLRHETESISMQKEAGNPAPHYAIGSGYSLLSCSPAELSAASPDKTNLQNQIAQFSLHSRLKWYWMYEDRINP